MYCPKCGSLNKDDAIYCQNCGTPLLAVAPPAPPIPVALPQYSSFWRRFGAFWIDVLILTTPLYTVSSLLTPLLIPDLIIPHFSTDVVAKQDPTYLISLLMAYSAILNIIFSVAGWLYFGFMTSSSKQATVGKMALGIIVTDENGKRLSFARSTARYFATYISDMTFNVGYLMIIWTKRKQALHDMIAGTLVVRKK